MGSADAPPPPRPHGSRLAGWIAAIIIVCSVVLAIAGVAEDKKAQEADGSRASLARMEESLEARYVVGMNELLGPMVEQSGPVGKTAWLEPFQAKAETPREKTGLAILQLEILGEDAAAKTLEAVALSGSEEAAKDASTLQTLIASGAGDVPQERREEFAKRHGWAGRLALTHGLPDSEPARAQVLGEARRTFGGAIILGCLTGGGFLLGCGLAVWGLIHFLSGRGVWRFAVHDLPAIQATGGSVWLETFAVYLGIMVLGGWLAGLLPEPWAPWPQGAAFLGAAVLAFWWPRLRGIKGREYRQGLGWTRGRGFFREMGAGFTGYLAGLPIVAAGVVLTVLLASLAQADASHPLNHMTDSPPAVLALLGVLAAVWAPLIEETFFRGAFYAAWRQKCGRWLSGLATGVLFAAVHPQGWTAIPALGAIGLVMALLREWRGSLIAPITAHALNNGTLFLIMILMMR